MFRTYERIRYFTRSISIVIMIQNTVISRMFYIGKLNVLPTLDLRFKFDQIYFNFDYNRKHYELSKYICISPYVIFLILLLVSPLSSFIVWKLISTGPDLAQLDMAESGRTRPGLAEWNLPWFDRWVFWYRTSSWFWISDF